MGNVNKNPGTFADLHKECKDLTPNTFEGGIFLVNNRLSNHFQISHTLSLWKPVRIGYRFGATYVGAKQFSPYEAFPVMLGDIDIWGNFNASIIHKFSEKILCKFTSQSQQRKITVPNLTTDYKGDSFSASMTIANTNIINNSGIIILQYLQSVTNKLALGGELLCQYGPHIPGEKSVVVSLAAKYFPKNSTWSANLWAGGLHLCGSKKINEYFQVGAELETNFHLQQSIFSIKSKFDIPEAGFVVRGMVDSNLIVSGVLETRLERLSCSISLSGLYENTKKQLKFGCGFTFG